MTDHRLLEAAKTYLEQTPPPTSRKGTEAWDALRAAIAASAAELTAAPTRAELLEAGGAIAECLEFALETHIYEPGEVPPDSGELLALEAWRRVTAPAPIARRDNVEYHQGANARRDGEPESANPFTASSDPDSRHARWALGWQEGAPGAALELTDAIADPLRHVETEEVA